MQIQTNLSSLFTQRKLAENAGATEQSLQRLSSGLRINSAKDDAAHMAIAERTTGQIRGNQQAWRNLNDGVSLLQTADGGLVTITDALQRMRELAVQAANGTLSASDRQSLQREVSQLVANVDQIGQQTTFNGEPVFDQNTVGVGGNDPNKRAVIDGLRLGWLEEAEKRIKQYYGIAATTKLDMNVNLATTDGVGGNLASVSTTAVGGNGQWQNITLNVDMADFTPPNLPDGGSAPVFNDRIIAHEMVHAVMARTMNFAALPNWYKEGMAEFIQGADERVNSDFNNTVIGWPAIRAAFLADNMSTSAGYSAGYSAVRYLHDRIKAHGGSGIKDITVYLSQNPGATLDQAITNASHGAFANLAAFNLAFQGNGPAFINAFNFTNADTGAIGGFDVDGGSVLSAKNVLLDIGAHYGDDNIMDGFTLVPPALPKNPNQRFMDFQAGANGKDFISIGVPAANASALGISDLDVSTPQFALVHIDEALDAVSAARARIGAALSRLDSARSNLQSMGENQQASRSRMLDTDYAEETAALTRNQILRNASTSMLAMANAQPKAVLRLLR